MNLPKLPVFYKREWSHELERWVDYWDETSVRAVQEEAYKAGIAAERERCFGICEGIANGCKETATGKAKVASVNAVNLCAQLIKEATGETND